MKKFLLLILFQPVILSILCQHPEINFEHISVEQGLADHHTNCIMQDHNGFIWIAGDNGLYKHNGYDFKVFKDQKNITAMLEDDRGLLWLYSPAGIKIFDPEKEKSMLVYSYLWDAAHGNVYVNYMMLRDSRGNIWASCQTGLVKLSYQENVKMPVTRETIVNQRAKSIFKIDLIQLSSHKYKPDNSVWSLIADHQGNIWAGSGDGLYVLRKGDQSFVRLDKGANRGTQQAIYGISAVLQIDENSYWVAAAQGLYLLTNVKMAFRESIPDHSLLLFSLKPMLGGQLIYSLFVDRNKNFLLGADKEIYKIKSDNKTGKVTFEPVSHSQTQPEWAGYGYTIHEIFEDRTGMLWTVQDYYGVSKFNMNQSKFTNYNDLIFKYFSSNDINPIYIDSKNNLWIGTYGGGLYKIQPESNNVAWYYPGSPVNNSIICLQESSPGIFWIGLNSGILEFNSISGKFRYPLPDTRTAPYLRWSMVWDMLKDGDQMYLATTFGLFVYNYVNKELYQFSFSSSSDDLSNHVMALIKMKNGEIWAGTVNYGINKIDFNSKNGSLSLRPVFTDKVLYDNGIDISYRYRLYEDSKGFLWIANYSGIHRINQKTGEVKNYRLFDNIEFPEVWSITEDAHNNLWLGTHSGLCRFNMETGKVKVFEKEVGVPILVHGLNSVYKDKGGRMYFGGLGGFYSFHPDSLKTNDSIPPIVITDLRLFNKSVKVDTTSRAILTKNISYTRLIELQHYQNDLSFQFSALDYNQPLKNKYTYILEGYQDKWVETDAKNRVATYTNLDPGTYTFRVKGSNNDGIWNDVGTSLTIIIHKPWWATALAWCIYMLIFLFLVGSYIRWRLWRIKKEKRKLEKLITIRTHQLEEQKDEIITQKEEILSQWDMLEQQNKQITEHEQLKSRFFTNVSHEFRTPLSLIQSPVEELLEDPHLNEKQRRKLNMVQRNARRLLNLVNQLLDISKIDGSKMKLELIESDVMKHLRAIAGAFNSMAETKSIQYHCHFAMEKILSWFDPDKLEKIATNLLSNAFKFTPEGGEIEFRASYINRDDTQTPLLLEFLVKDTGPGIPAKSLEKIFDRFYQLEESVKAEGGGTGIGLSLARDLARLLQGEIAVYSEQGKGSTFSVQFPLGKNHLKESEFIQLNAMPESVAYVPELHEKLEEVISDQRGKPTGEYPVILIVEDNADIRMQLSDNLNREYIIREAIDGVAGLKKATEMIPDLVITDLMMPRMDGIELCDKLKNDERTSHIPVIMLTAKVTPEDKITGFHTGADDYVPKPFNMAELKARVANLIDQRKKLRERFSREVTLQPSDISITPLDEQFLSKAIQVVEQHLDDENFDLPEFRKKMNMSRTTLFRKLHALTDQSPSEFIRTIRLKRAANLLEQKFGNVTQVSLEVGFNNISYFIKSFKKLYGVSPMEYTKQH